VKRYQLGFLPWQPFIADKLTIVTEEMGLSKDNLILIKYLYKFKGYGAKRLMKEFLTEGWKMLERTPYECSKVWRQKGRE